MGGMWDNLRNLSVMQVFKTCPTKEKSTVLGIYRLFS